MALLIEQKKEGGFTMKKTISLICVMLCTVFVLLSCSSDKKISQKTLDKLEEGMTEEDVTDLLGSEGYPVFTTNHHRFWRINSKEYVSICFGTTYHDGNDWYIGDYGVVKYLDGSLYKINSFTDKERVEEIKKGMPRSEVNEILGNAYDCSSSGLRYSWVINEDERVIITFDKKDKSFEEHTVETVEIETIQPIE